MWISKNLRYTRNKNFDDNKNPIIAIKVGYPYAKKINVIGHYRQFKCQDANKRNSKEEKLHFEDITSKISKLNEDNEKVIYIGDININLAAIDINENKKIQNKKTQNGLIKILK